jgi:transglutaminase-like putative cysteine protease
MFDRQESQYRWWDLPAALILLVAVYLAGLRLAATDWTEELEIIPVIAVTAILSGLALGQSLFSRRQVAIFSLIFGLFVMGWQMGNLMGPGVLWLERVTSLGGRLGVSLQNLVRQRAVTDPILFVFLMSSLFWILSSHAGYSLTRHANAWRASLPLGAALFIIHIHDPFWPTRSWFVAGYIFLALLLVSRAHFLQSRAKWKENRTHLPPYVGLDFLKATMMAGAIIILLAWTAPALAASVPPAEQAWQRLSRPLAQARSEFTNFFAALRATSGIVTDYYGDTLPLGRGNTLTEQVVLTVIAPPRPVAGVRYYWRARVYDEWDGTRWTTYPTARQEMSPDDFALPFADLDGRWEAGFQFFPAIPMGTLYTAPQPQWVSRPVNAEVIVNDDSSVDLHALNSVPVVRPGEVYEVQSSLTNVTISQLRAAGTDYPDWIKERYLEVPNTITPRTLELAQTIAADYDNAYDTTEAVTEWMRQNITYNEIVPTPPQNRDILDWMLFDLKQGFCNYYATAEIILLRSLGIPARIAVGYAQGELNRETNTYTVRQRDAHAWPEVYFPGVGWVEFEPTLNQRPLRRPVGDPIGEDDTASGILGDDANVADQNLEEILGFEPLDDSQVNPEESSAPDEVILEPPPAWIFVVIPIALGVVGLSTIGIWRSRRRTVAGQVVAGTPIPVQIEKSFTRIGLRPPEFLVRWAYQAKQPQAARSYQEINRALQRLGADSGVGATPNERATALVELLPQARPPAEMLVEAYNQLLYSSTNGSTDDPPAEAAQRAGRDIWILSWSARFKGLLNRFQQPRDRDLLVK